MESQFIEKDCRDYRCILVPEDHLNSNGWKYSIVKGLHPISNNFEEFIVAKNDSGNGGEEIVELYLLDKVNWKNYNIKNLQTTPDGKPYNCMFIKNGDENIDEALIIGSNNELFIMTLFSPVYLLLGYFKNQFIKSNDNDSKRLISYEDLIDSICDIESFINILVNEYNMKFNKYLTLISEMTKIDEEEYFKPSINKSIEFLCNKIDMLGDKLMNGRDIYKSLHLRIDTMYNREIPNDIKEEIWKKQAVSIMSAFVDKWYIDQISGRYNFNKLETFTNDLKLQQQAQDTFTETLEQMHENSMNEQRTKKSKVSVKGKVKASKPVVKVKSGALDMFFKKKE